MNTHEADFNAAQFLRTLHAAYELSTGQPHGVVEKLRVLYRVLTWRPQTRRTYSEQAFAQDVYRLDRELMRLTPTGLQCRLHPGATGARNRRNLLVVTTQDGIERTYYGIEFLSG